jgi:hypothetical protein
LRVELHHGCNTGVRDGDDIALYSIRRWIDSGWR